MEHARDRLVELKESLRRLTGGRADPAPGPLPGAVATGWPGVDALLPGGGFARGRIAELAGGRSSGKTTLALAAVARATGAGQLVAWIDPRGELYPPSAAALGVDLERLLVVRPPDTTAAMARAVEIIADSRAFPLVVVDGGEGRQFTGTAAARLRGAAHGGGVALLLLGATSGVATLRLAIARDDAGLAVTAEKGAAVAPGERVLVAPEAAPVRDFLSPAATRALTAAAASITLVPAARRR